MSAGLNGQSQRATELCVKDTTKPYYGKDRPGYLSDAVTRHPQKQLRGGKACTGSRFERIQSSMAGKAWRPEQKAAPHIVSSGDGKMKAGGQLAFLFIHSVTPVYRMVPPTFGVGLFCTAQQGKGHRPPADVEWEPPTVQWKGGSPGYQKRGKKAGGVDL